MLGLALAQFALTPPPPSPSPPPPRPPGESGSGGEEITWTTCDNNGPCTNREAGANFKCTNNGYCNCGDATNCWCDGNNGHCDCGAASRCMCDSNNGYCACPRSGSKCTTTDPFFLDDDDVQQQCDFSSEFSSDSDFACACARNNGDCGTTSYSGGSSDDGDGGDGGGRGLHISIMFPSIFFPIFFCIALFTFMACYGNRRRRALNWHLANLEFENAANLSALSAEHWDQDDVNEYAGDHAVLPDGGYGALLHKLAAGIEVRYHSPVVAIESRDDGSAGSAGELIRVVTMDEVHKGTCLGQGASHAQPHSSHPAPPSAGAQGGGRHRHRAARRAQAHARRGRHPVRAAAAARPPVGDLAPRVRAAEQGGALLPQGVLAAPDRLLRAHGARPEAARPLLPLLQPPPVERPARAVGAHRRQRGAGSGEVGRRRRRQRGARSAAHNVRQGAPRRDAPRNRARPRGSPPARASPLCCRCRSRRR